MVSYDEARDLIGATAYDSTGDKIGQVGQVFLDDATGQPEWISVNTGLFGMKESFIPLAGASLSASELRVGYDKSTVKDAPKVDPDGGALSQQEEARLYSHYGVTYSEAASESGLPAGGAPTSTGAEDPRDRDRDGVLDDVAESAVGRDTSGLTTDDAMTRSEERLRVGTEQREAGRARLRKYVVTEQVQQTVPVRREEVRVEREPITDANIGDAMDGPAISEEEHEVTLHAERPVVEKEAVPVERVRMDVDTVTEQQQVSESVRKEQIEADTPTDTKGRGRR